MVEKIYKIKIYANDVFYENEEGERITFKSFKGILLDGTKIDVKFKKDCNLIPTKSGTIYVNSTKMNFDTSKVYKTLWVSNVKKFEELVEDTSKFDNYFEKVE